MVKWPPKALWLLCALLFVAVFVPAQNESTPGHSIGKVYVKGEQIILELDEGALGKANLFDLVGHTLHFAPDKNGYRVTPGPLRWDPNYGPELTTAIASLHSFEFPFSGKAWKSFAVGSSGSIRFGVSENEVAVDPYGHRDGGVILDRFDQLADFTGPAADQSPAICVFLKPRLSGSRYVKELADRVVVTWDVTEPFGGLLDFTWFKTINRFQAVLSRDGSIDLSYKEVAAKDAIVGVFSRSMAADKPARVHFSSLSERAGPFGSVYESFHYLQPPRPQDLSCTIIRALGDKFDFLAYYSDFRIDAQEASPPSDGPLGGKVTGIGNTQHEQTKQVLDSRCTQGRFQLGLASPVYVGANEAQPWPPQAAPTGGRHDLTFYRQQLAEASPGRKPSSYNYAVGHLGHEVGHRWGAYVTAKVNGAILPLGQWPHWAPGLQSRVAFPYSLPVEASTLGGGVWQDNGDGTFTQVRDGFFVPASGYSYLDLYLMGFTSAAEVPDFFILRNLSPVGKDAAGRQVFKAERTKITIQDVIAAEGLRLPDVNQSQRKFNIGIVVVVEHGKSVRTELSERARGIGRQWIEYWRTATGNRASMSVNDLR